MSTSRLSGNSGRRCYAGCWEAGILGFVVGCQIEGPVVMANVIITGLCF